MWWWIWTALLLISLGVILALCWRIFKAVRDLLVTLGEMSGEAAQAGADAERRHDEWLDQREVADAEYFAARQEAARPVPASRRPRPDVSSLRPQTTREAQPW